MTTLAINASSPHSEFTSRLPTAEVQSIFQWLLHQQYKEEHPFTHAEPGGWAWTDLSGGVPDADDTAGALLALANLNVKAPQIIQAAAKGVRWLINLQNRDGGIPTFCHGWGRLAFDRSSADITAHALRAFAVWKPFLPDTFGPGIEKAMKRAIHYLLRTQNSDGFWVPLWFGNQEADGDINPVYGTSRVLAAFTALLPHYPEMVQSALSKAVPWMLKARNHDGGWGGDQGIPSSIEETALAVDALARVLQLNDWFKSEAELSLKEKIESALHAGASWLIRETERGAKTPPAPIGFYFASLWYFEKLYPIIFSISALNQLKLAITLYEGESMYEESSVFKTNDKK